MSHAKVSSKAGAILNLSCPHCRQGDLFNTPTFSFKQPFDMKKKCEVCDQNFMLEPGFYYGAMYVSYGFVGGFSLAFIALFHWVLGWSINSSFALLLAISALFFVYLFRLSRSFWLGVHVKYESQARSKE